MLMIAHQTRVQLVQLAKMKSTGSNAHAHLVALEPCVISSFLHEKSDRVHTRAIFMCIATAGVKDVINVNVLTEM